LILAALRHPIASSVLHMETTGALRAHIALTAVRVNAHVTDVRAFPSTSEPVSLLPQLFRGKELT
jgi:hypothetical protein